MDIFKEGDHVALLGPGWYALENFKGESFRWASNDAKLNVACLRSAGYRVSLTLEPGPGVGLKPFDLRVTAESVAEVASLAVRGRETVSFDLPPGEPTVHRLTLHVENGGKSAVGDSRVLNFRVFKISVEQSASDVLPAGVGLKLGAGWYPVESFNGETFRWAGNEAIVESLNPAKAGSLRMDVEPGPGVGFGPFKLSVMQNGSSPATIEVKGRQSITIPLPQTEQATKVRLTVEGGGKTVPGDARILNFRAFILMD